jgi:hypothetical protein
MARPHPTSPPPPNLPSSSSSSSTSSCSPPANLVPPPPHPSSPPSAAIRRTSLGKFGIPRHKRGAGAGGGVWGGGPPGQTIPPARSPFFFFRWIWPGWRRAGVLRISHLASVLLCAARARCYHDSPRPNVLFSSSSSLSFEFGMLVSTYRLAGLPPCERPTPHPRWADEPDIVELAHRLGIHHQTRPRSDLAARPSASACGEIPASGVVKTFDLARRASADARPPSFLAIPACDLTPSTTQRTHAVVFADPPTATRKDRPRHVVPDVGHSHPFNPPDKVGRQPSIECSQLPPSVRHE